MEMTLKETGAVRIRLCMYYLFVNLFYIICQVVVYADIYVYMYVSVCLCLYVCMYVCRNMLYIHTYIHTYTHTGQAQAISGCQKARPFQEVLEHARNSAGNYGLRANIKTKNPGTTVNFGTPGYFGLGY